MSSAKTSHHLNSASCEVAKHALTFGPPNHDCDEEREWWDRHRVAASEWVLRHYPNDDHETELAEFGVSTLLTTPTMRAWGEAIGLEGREPYTWEGIDAYEILFDALAEGGIMHGWDHMKIAVAIRGCAAHFADNGLMDTQLHARLDAELEVWIPHLDAFFTGGKWPKRPQQKSAHKRRK